MNPVRRPGTRPRHGWSAIVTLLLGVLLAATALVACGSGDDSVDTSSSEPAPTTTEATGTGTTAAGTPSGTVAPDAAGVTLNVTFLDGGKVATGHRRVAPTQAVARAALDQLVAGPNATEQGVGYSSGIATGTKVGGIDIAGGVATVDLTPAVTDHAEQAQVVYTLTQFPSVEKVRFGSGGTPVTRADYRDVTPLIFLESVAPGDIVSSPVTVAGDANTFEATVQIKVVGADGSVLVNTFTTATSGSGTWGTFSKDVPFNRADNTSGKVVVFWDSPKDGTPQDVTEVPVTFR